MELPDEYLKSSDIAYPQILQIEKDAAEEIRYRFLAINAEEWNKEYPKAIVAGDLKMFHKALMFFKGDNLLLRLSEFNLVEEQLRWFVSLGEIDDLFNLIKSKGIKIDRSFALLFIRIHLDFNFSNELLFWATGEVIDDEVRMNILAKTLIDIKERRHYNQGGDPKRSKDWLDSFLNDLLKECIEFNNSNECDIKMDLIDATKGKTEKIYLKAMMEYCFDYDKKQYSENEFLGIVYDLFRIILIGYGLPKDDDDFLYNVKGIYQGNFNIYKAKKLKGILKLDMKKV